MNWLKSHWVQKPPLGTELDHGHQLARGLVGCWIMNEGCGNVIRDLSGAGNHASLVNFSFPPTTTSGWHPGAYGPSLLYDGNDYATVAQADVRQIPLGNAAYTTMVCFQGWQGATERHGLLGYGGYGGSRQVNALRSCNEAAHSFMNYWWGDDFQFDVGTFDAGPHVVAVTYNLSKRNAYFDGRWIAENTPSGTPNFSVDSGGLRIGQTYTELWYGTINWALLYNRALTDLEIAMAYSTPFAMVVSPMMWVVAGELPSNMPMAAMHHYRMRRAA